jgi:hypothetical protein
MERAARRNVPAAHLDAAVVEVGSGMMMYIHSR